MVLLDDPGNREKMTIDGGCLFQFILFDIPELKGHGVSST
jgi:hypothetical protein